MIAVVESIGRRTIAAFSALGHAAFFFFDLLHSCNYSAMRLIVRGQLCRGSLLLRAGQPIILPSSTSELIPWPMESAHASTDQSTGNGDDAAGQHTHKISKAHTNGA